MSLLRSRAGLLTVAAITVLLLTLAGVLGPSLLQAESEPSANRPASEDNQISREDILEDPDNPVLGNPEGDVTIVEYFDYQCPYCKAAHPGLMEVVESDGNIRLVMKDWPIFGDASLYAARLVLAAEDQGAYEQAQQALMESEGKLAPEQVDRLLTDAGVDLDRAKADLQRNAERIDALLERNHRQARALELAGTPAFIIGPYLVPGMVDAETLRQAVAEARQE